MFHIGDKIFYPLHGAGVVQAIEEKEILGEKALYYMLNMTLRNLQVMIPVGKAANLQIREVVPLDVLENALTKFHKGGFVSTVPHQQRRRMNIDKMKSGDIYEGVEVILDLTHLNHTKKLGVEEKLMLDLAKQMLVSELVVRKGLTKDEAASLLEQPILT